MCFILLLQASPSKLTRVVAQESFNLPGQCISHGTYLDQYLVISSSSQPLQTVSHVLTAAGYSDPHNGGKVEAVFQKPKRMPPHRQAEGTVIHLWNADVSISSHYACLAEASCPSPFGPGDGR